jgi:hypothetical protein
MSAIAEMNIVPRTALPQIAEATTDPKRYAETLSQVSQGAFLYRYSGWVLATLLPVLSMKYGIGLMKSEQPLATQLSQATGATYVILTMREKEVHLERLQADNFDASKLRTSFEAFNRVDVPEAGKFMLDGIRFLRAGLDKLSEDSVAVLCIG